MRRAKGPRLDLETRSGREPLWRIRDGEKAIRLGLPEEQRAEAERRLAEYLTDKHAPSAVVAAPGEISIPEVLAFYHRSLTRRVERKKTDAVRRSTDTRIIHINNLLTFWADKTVADVRTSVCEAYADHRRAQPPGRGMRKGATAVADSTIRQELKSLERALSVWHGEEPLAALPIVAKPDPTPAKLRYLERAEAAKLIRAARRLGFPHLVRYILIGVYTGTRDDRIRRLRWMRASLDGYIDASRGILYRAGFAEEQTSKRAPPMILPDRLLLHIRRWARAAGSHVVTYRGQPVGDIHKSWASTVKAAGLGPDVTPHTLKHTAISWMLHEGRSIWEVAEDTGTSSKTIEAVYGHHRSIDSKLARAGNGRPIWRISGA
jgi:integrase